MSKYKEGDTFEGTVRIKSIGLYEDYPYTLEVVELGEELEGGFDENDISKAFDPNYPERVRLAEIKELEERLEELKKERNYDN